MSDDEMDLNGLAQLCFESINNAILWGNPRYAQITLVIGKKPKGFPRGDFLSENHKGKVYRFPSMRVLSWIIETCEKLQGIDDENTPN